MPTKEVRIKCPHCNDLVLSFSTENLDSKRDMPPINTQICRACGTRFRVLLKGDWNHWEFIMPRRGKSGHYDDKVWSHKAPRRVVLRHRPSEPKPAPVHRAASLASYVINHAGAAK